MWVKRAAGGNHLTHDLVWKTVVKTEEKEVIQPHRRWKPVESTSAGCRSGPVGIS